MRKFRSFSDVLRFHAENSPDKVFLYDGSTGKNYTFGQLDILVDRAVSYLRQKDLGPGSVISVILNNRVEYIVLFFSALRLGVTFNPFPFNLGQQNLEKYLLYVQPKVVFCENKHFDYLVGQGWNVELIGDDFLTKLEGVTQYDKYDYFKSDDDAACIYYSSGTTGNPKGVVFSHKNMIANISSIVRGFNWTQEDCHLVFLPMGHTAAINYSFLPCAYCGGKIALFESFWKIRNKVWQYIVDFDVSYMEVVPSILFSLLNTSYPNYDRKKLKRFKYIGCGSAPLPLKTQEAIYDKFQLKVANLYGLSETGPTHIDNPLEEGWQPGSIGYPLDVNDIKILDENGVEVPDCVAGEIAVKGPNVFIGYYKNEAGYDKAFKNGYFLTGDIGFRSKNGKFYFSDRAKDLIIKGGVNIFPGEIDEVVFSHPSVKEAATIGVPDSYLGEAIHSYIVLKDKEIVVEEEIRTLCLQKLGDFKCPDKFIFVDDIPKGPSGKLLRKELRNNAGN